jgi:methylenetetrahydrofolate reductase (NADPH)
MKISDVYKVKKFVFSCEVFPPRPGVEIEEILKTIKELKSISPDFVSVTYGAGGGTKSRTIEIASKIKKSYKMEPLMHLSCIDTKKEDIDNILNEISQNGIENILALRGDIPNDRNLKFIGSDFSYASDLVVYIKFHRSNFCLGVAGYPEVHPEAYSMEKDIKKLKKKIDAGASFIISQLFFKNDFFYRYLDMIRKMGINVPVSAGIMPVFKAKLLNKMIKLSRATVPSDLIAIVEKYKDKDKEMEKAGIEYAVNQIRDLIDNGVDGVHLFTMNCAYLAKKISSYSGLR